MLETNKNNTKGTWNILNSILRKKNKSTGVLPKEFFDNGKVINNDEEVAEGFNKFFVNIGPKLAEDIIPPQGGGVGHLSGNPATIILRDSDAIEVMTL